MKTNSSGTVERLGLFFKVHVSDLLHIKQISLTPSKYSILARKIICREILS